VTGGNSGNGSQSTPTLKTSENEPENNDSEAAGKPLAPTITVSTVPAVTPFTAELGTKHICGKCFEASTCRRLKANHATEIG